MITFVADWVIQDALILVVGMMTVLFILKKEPHPAVSIMEMVCYCFLYAGLFENLATLVNYYSYGQSIVMYFNVPLSVPVIEFLVVYVSLRLSDHMRLPNWSKPFFAGLMGMLFDFTLDPVATKEIFATPAGTLGRWTWHIGPTDVNILGIPVHNFSGWILISGLGAAFLLLGRYWYKKSNYSPRVGFAYPIVCMLAALVVLFMPTSSFLLLLAPFFSMGGIGEWIMFGVLTAISFSVLIFVWRGRMVSGFTFRSEYPTFLVLLGFHLSDITFALIGGLFSILWLEFLITAIQWGLVLFIYYRGKALHLPVEKKPAEEIETTGSS
jgi:hypothetical protein